MLHFITGRAGSGKSTHVRSLLKDYAGAGMSGMTLIVPEQASFVTEREMLRLLGPRDAEKVDVLSFTRLAENVLSNLPHGRLPKIDDGGRAVLMSLALDGVTEKLNVYKKQGKSTSVVNELIKLSDEFKRCAVTPLDLLKVSGAMEDCLLKTKLNEISVVLEAYEALVSQRFEDDRDLLTLLYGALPESGCFKGKVVAIDEFSGFTRQEYNVIERILPQAMDVYVTLCTDDVFTREDGSFAYITRTAQKLIDAANRANVSVATPDKISDKGIKKPDALLALDRSLFEAQDEPFECEADMVTVCTADGIYDECAFVAAEIKRLLREENYRCREIAVIARNADTYEASLKSAMKKCGVPVFEDRRQPVITQPLVTLIRAASDIAANGFDCDRLMRFLKTGLTDVSEEDVCTLENYALMWGVSGEKWLSDFTGNPDGLGAEMTQDCLERLEKINHIRAKSVASVKAFRDFIRDTDGEGFAAAVYELLVALGSGERLKALAVKLEETGEPVLALEQERVWNLTMEMLDLIAVTVGKTRLSPRRLAEIFDIILNTKTLGSIPQGLDETAIGSADRIVTSSPKAVFIVGANDGVFPKDPVMRGMLNDTDRKKLRELGLELYDSGEYRVIYEHFLVYKSLTSASQRLYVTYTLSDADGSAAAPSDFVRELTTLFPNCRQVETSNLAQSILPEGLAPAFEQVCLNRRAGGEVYKAVRRVLSNRDDYKAKLAALDRATENKPFTIDDRTIARSLFGGNLYLSASRVERYHQCPFSYFCQYGLSAKPRKRAEFDPSQQGSEIHFVLENILRRFGKDGLLKMTPQKRADEVKKLLDSYLSDKLGGGDNSERFTYLYNRLAKTLCEILERLVLEFSVCSFEPVDFELKIDLDGDLKPYEIKLDNGDAIVIRGSADRVDKFDDGGRQYVRVVDYKSGAKTFLLSEALNGLNLQMLLYLFAIWENGGQRYGGEIMPAGILYMPAKAVFTGTDRDADEKTVSAQKAKSLKMNGMLLKNELVIAAMDSSGSGTFIPAYIKKDGELKGTLITLEQLGKVRAETDNLLREMAGALHDGQIPALPVSAPHGGKSVCDYCDYKSVCGHESDSPVRTIERFKHDDCLKLLEGGEVKVETDVDD